MLVTSGKHQLIAAPCAKDNAFKSEKRQSDEFIRRAWRIKVEFWRVEYVGRRRADNLESAGRID